MTGSGGENLAEPNLTPLLDLVFQLIAFFMLVINFRTLLIDRDVRLPVSGSARPAIASDDISPIIVNVRATGELTVVDADSAEPQLVSAEHYFQQEASKRKSEHDSAMESAVDASVYDTVVVIRADAATPFTAINHTLGCCRRNGFHRIALKTLKEDQPRSL